MINLNQGYAEPYHLRPLTDALEKSLEEPVELVVSLPPGHSKTESLLHAVPWLLLRRPERRIFWASHTDSLAKTNAARARWLCKAVGIELDPSTHAKAEWNTTAGGGLYACGIGAATGGRRGDLLVIDDPFRNRAEAESPTGRRHVIDWFGADFYSRRKPGNPGASVIVCQTRWHQDDLAGTLIGRGWKSVVFPALDEDENALWPEVWPKEELFKIRDQVGAYDWASLYQGNPQPKGAQIFGDPVRYDTPKLDGARLIISADVAATAKTRADYTVLTLLGITGYGEQSTAQVLHVERFQAELPDVVQRLVALQARYPGTPIVVEATGVGKAVPQMLKRMRPDLRVREYHPKGDKFTRAQPCAAAWNVGRISVPIHAPWLEDWLGEILSFTGVGDAHDDCVDSLTIAWDHAQYGAGLRLIEGMRDGFTGIPRRDLSGFG